MGSDKSSKKNGRAQKSTRRLSMVGCGTPEIMFKAAVRKQFGKMDGVVGIEFKDKKIILRVRDDRVKARIEAQYQVFMGRKVEAVVVGNIVKRFHGPRK